MLKTYTTLTSLILFYEQKITKLTPCFDHIFPCVPFLFSSFLHPLSPLSKPSHIIIFTIVQLFQIQKQYQMFHKNYFGYGSHNLLRLKRCIGQNFEHMDMNTFIFMWDKKTNGYDIQTNGANAARLKQSNLSFF